MTSVQAFQHIILLYLSAALILVGILTSAWTANWKVKKIDIKLGLFKHCVEDHCVPQEGDKTAKGMEIVGLAAAVFCSICMTVYQAIHSKGNKIIKLLPQTTFYTAISGAGVVFLGCAIYAFDNYGNGLYPGYSFVLVAIGGIVLIVGGATSSKK